MPHKRNQRDGGAVEGGVGVETGTVESLCRSLRHPGTLYGATASGLYRSEAAMGLSAAQPQTTPALGHLIEAEYHLRAAGQNIVADLIRLETRRIARP